MNFPYTLSNKLSTHSVKIWEKIILPTKGTKNDKTFEESLWRRNQTEKNQKVSGWNGDRDKRRKIVYYKHQYDVTNIHVRDKKQLVLESTIVYECFTLPKEEVLKYKESLIYSAVNGKWVASKSGKNQNNYTKGDLVLKIKHYNSPSDRAKEYQSFPTNYQTIEITLKSNNFKLPKNLQNIIWNVAKHGLRNSLPRDNAKYVTSVNEIIKNFPCQIELGCGAPYEAGVPPLHELHDTYFINEPFTKKFIITEEKDQLMKNCILNSEKSLKKFSVFYSKILSAELTPFYKILKSLRQKGYIVGPILTNNFDGIHLRLSIPEIFLRTYTESDVMPNIDFDSKAKSLLVIGCHADRRNVEKKARESGLKVMYIDPEGWFVDGKFIEYPLESPQKNDLIYKKGASEAFEEIEKVLLK